MSSSDFKFKQFTVRHDRTTMKVGTDGVLLGAWVEINRAKNILDIGTGSGLIALMLAQRTTAEAIVDAVEIEAHAFEQARENIIHSPWPDKIKIHHTSIQNFHSSKNYDLIVSNPPYFQNSQPPPDVKRLLTRHTITLTYFDLISSVKKLLTEHGKFNLILPYSEGLEFINLATQNQLNCTRQWSFRSRKEKPIERWLLEFSLHPGQKSEQEILLYDTAEVWSEEYKQLTKNFYLNL